MAETKRSGEYELSCGHKITKALDVEKRHQCPTCKRDAIVIRVLR